MMRRTARAAWTMSTALTATLALTSCMTVGPEYSRPPVEVPASWKTIAAMEGWKPAEPKASLPRDMWWEAFRDPSLNALVEQAVHANQQLRQAVARVREARALARVEEAGLWPEASLDPTVSRERRGRLAAGSFVRGGFTNTQYRVPFDVAYEVDLWGRVRRNMEAALAEADARSASFHTMMLTLAADVVRNYIQLRELDEEQRILADTVALRQEALELMKRRAESGVSNEVAVSLVATELASAKEDLLDVGRQRAEVENALAVLCGRPAQEFTVELGGLEMGLPSVPVGLPSSLLERRPDVAEAERRMMAANARIGVAKAAFFPAISLTGATGFESPELSDLFTKDTRLWSLGPKLSLPLFTGGRNTANLKAARARYEESVAAYRQEVLEAFAEVENALVNLKWLDQQARAQDEVVATSRNTASLSMTRFKEGLIGYLDVVDAERSRLQAELGAVRIRSQRLIASVLLIKALGGGWESYRQGQMMDALRSLSEE